MNKNAFLIANETWFKKRDPHIKYMLDELEAEKEIKAIRKDRKLSKKGLAHGGVAAFFDSSKCNMRKLSLYALRGNIVREFEILAVRGNLKINEKEPTTFTLETHEYIKLTYKGTLKCNDLIVSEDWSNVAALSPDAEAMVSTFQNILDTHIISCFSRKRIRRKSNDSPWLTDGLRSLMKKRLSIYRSEGRSTRWKKAHGTIYYLAWWTTMPPSYGQSRN